LLNSRIAEQQSDWQSENWTEVLGSERLTGAALDRLTHRCHILETKGESFRLQDAKRRRRRMD
jgi:DNA replication protein DnaC